MVKSLATIDLLPPACKLPSIFNPEHPIPNIVTFCAYGDRRYIQARLSNVPVPGSKLTNAPPVGRLVIYAFSAVSVPNKPVSVTLRIPLPLRI